MPRSPTQLRRDALAIWLSGVAAVASHRLVANALRVEGQDLAIGEERFPLEGIRRIAVVGAGKAGAGMAAAVETALGPRLCEQKQLAGIVNVPADCIRPLTRIVLRPARPAGVNEPTPEGVAATEEILRLVRSLGAADLCLCLLSGGGSALLPAPEGVSLEEKVALTRRLNAAGATIEELNIVRKQLSRIKGGGLARACRAGRLAALVISDVPGDWLDLIASGPTAPDSSTPEAAIEILQRYAAGLDFLPRRYGVPAREETPRPGAAADVPGREPHRWQQRRRGRRRRPEGDVAGLQSCPGLPKECEGPAEDVGRHLAAMRGEWLSETGPDCLISGGEPIVRLVEASRRGLGGRNQQLALAVLQSLAADGAEGIALLSAGTDGEDGPTDAAGAFCDASVLAAARRLGLDPADSLARNDAYHFFEATGGLVKTGPLDTNVGDVRVVLVAAAWQGVMRRSIMPNCR